MSVIGIGTDIVDIRRIDNMSDKACLRLAKRILTTDELTFYAQKSQPKRFLAKRWAAKEAAAKALGTGIASGVSFQHFMIKSLPSGKPELELSAVALQIAKELGAEHWHISLSDEKHYATAFVILSA